MRCRSCFHYTSYCSFVFLCVPALSLTKTQSPVAPGASSQPRTTMTGYLACSSVRCRIPGPPLQLWSWRGGRIVAGRRAFHAAGSFAQKIELVSRVAKPIRRLVLNRLAGITARRGIIPARSHCQRGDEGDNGDKDDKGDEGDEGD
ncbi:hypothetical protein E2C01_095298 [Portunus trituberculatus]|uniref:Secreted protein n=1 Tax=Portunus trituberculatus TaxID=210409 RepID=A0A5B7JZU2_PORTR|nr:hypothetical protein [Portunus trituberculatus]